MQMRDPLSGMNRRFCLYSNNSNASAYLGLLQKNISLSGLWSCDQDAKSVCLWVCVYVCDLGYVFSSGLGIMESSLFSFFSSFASQLAPTIWHQALKSRPSLSHQNGMKIYPHIPSRPVALSQVSRRLQVQITGLVGWMEYRGFDGSMETPDVSSEGENILEKCIKVRQF